MNKQRVLISRGIETIEVEITAAHNQHRSTLELSAQFPYWTKTFAESKTEVVRRAAIRLSVDRGILPSSLADLVEQVCQSMDAQSYLWFNPEKSHLVRDPEGGYGAQLDLSPIPQLLQRAALEYIKERINGEEG